MIKITLENKEYEFPEGITIMEILDHIGSCDKRITVGAIVNNR